MAKQQIRLGRELLSVVRGSKPVVRGVSMTFILTDVDLNTWDPFEMASGDEIEGRFVGAETISSANANR